MVIHPSVRVFLSSPSKAHSSYLSLFPQLQSISSLSSIFSNLKCNYNLMAAELGLLSLTQLQKLAQQQQNPNLTVDLSSWMWNPKQQQSQDDEEESWEVRAFAEDTGSIMGTAWPPRSYTCTFCRREFRSAQALGGHMNVHRRDRARLHHQTQPPLPLPLPLPPPSSSSSTSATSTSSSSTFIVPTQEFVTNGSGLCLLYQLQHNPNPNPNPVSTAAVFTSSTTNTMMNSCSSSSSSPSTLLSISPYLPNNTILPRPPPPRPLINYSGKGPTAMDSSLRHPRKPQQTPSLSDNNNENSYENNDTTNSKNCNKDLSVEEEEKELDLELRL